MSPTTCVLIRKVRGQKRFRCEPKRVEDFNYRTANMAERYIFAHQDSEQTRALLQMAAKTRQQPKVDRDEMYRIIDERKKNPFYNPWKPYYPPDA